MVNYMTEKKIAVILVNYNGLDDTLACIESLQKSTINSQIVVVDNASLEDESIKIAQYYKNVKIFRENRNLGFAGGNNIGIKWALEQNFEYIALLNNDTIVKENLLEQLLSVVDENIVVAPYMYYYYYPNELWYGGGYLSHFTAKATHITHPQKNDNTFECSFVTGCCFLAHRTIWKKVGILDDSYFMYLEDVDFSARILQNNFKIVVNPQAKLWHKVGKSTGNNSAFRMYYITRNRFLLQKKQKKSFSNFAIIFIYVTMFFRIFRCVIKRNHLWKCILQGICDGRKGFSGITF